MGHEGSKEKDLVEFSNKERTVTKKRKLMLEDQLTRIKSATKLVGGRTSTSILEENPVDAIIRDLEGVRYRVVEYEHQTLQVAELVGGRFWLSRCKRPSKLRARCES